MKYKRSDALFRHRQECVRAEYLDSSDDESLPESVKRYCQSWALCHRYRMLMPQPYSFYLFARFIASVFLLRRKISVRLPSMANRRRGRSAIALMSALCEAES
jgi:hypothetical protein